MKRFLRDIGIGAVVLLVLFGVAECIAESIPNSYTYKREYMEQHGGEIKTLILGSSNAYDGLCPEVFTCGAFNLANSSQTLEDDYLLLERYIDDMDSLQTVIVGVGYHSLGAVTEDNRRTYYTIYMGLYPRWPISKYSFEVFNLELLTKKIIKYAISRDVTRCDSLGQRVGHTAEAVKEQREFWNKDATELALRDSYEWYKNTKNTADAAINNKNRITENALTRKENEKENTHSTSAMPDGPRGLERKHPQTPTSELAVSVDANTPNMLPECSKLNAFENGSVAVKNIQFLYKIIQLCEAHHVRPVIVTMPVRKEYKEALPKGQIALHDSVMSNFPLGAIYIDASDWVIPEDGWYNATHLTKEESVEFTERVRDSVESRE